MEPEPWQEPSHKPAPKQPVDDAFRPGNDLAVAKPRKLTPAQKRRRSLRDDVFARKVRGQDEASIATELGLTTKLVAEIINREVKERPIPSMITYRKILTARYERLATTLEPWVFGYAIDPATGAETNKPSLPAVDRWLGVQSRIARLHGVNAPDQKEVTHSGEVVHTHDVTRLIGDRLAQMRENLDANQASLAVARAPLPAIPSMDGMVSVEPVEPVEPVIEGEIVEDA